MTEKERAALVEAAASPHRARAPDGRVVASSAWHDLDEAGRREVYEAARAWRRIEAALDPDGLSGTARAVLDRLGRSAR